MIRVPVHQLDPELPLPTYAKPGDAGVDLYARGDVLLGHGGGRSLVPTGIVVAVPQGYAGLVLPRSGLALAHGVSCLNTPGLVDSGYRGELSVLLINTDPVEDYQVRRGDRVAQFVIQSVETLTLLTQSLDALPASERATGGFGHSGR
ncbi:MAG: dUTP diphosphatase [Acidimicrobiales bacterium]